MFRFALTIVAAAFALLPLTGGVQAAAQTCLTASESREAVQAHNLARPDAVQRNAAREAQADPLRSRLCRWNNELVYEITLLSHDGKVLHVFVKARDGLIVSKVDE